MCVSHLVDEDNGEVDRVSRDLVPGNNVGTSDGPTSYRVGLGDLVGEGRGSECKEDEGRTHG